MTGMSDEQLAILGYISVLWNAVERNMVACIWAVANWKQEVGEVVTADLNNIGRIDLFSNLVKLNIDDERLLDQSKITVKAYDLLRVARNDLMHGFFNWQHRGLRTDNSLIKFSGKKRNGTVEMKVIQVHKETLETIASDLLLCNESFHDLLNKFIFRRRYLDGERGVFAQNYEDAVHGWRAPSFDTSLLLECLKKRS